MTRTCARCNKPFDSLTARQTVCRRCSRRHLHKGEKRPVVHRKTSHRTREARAAMDFLESTKKALVAEQLRAVRHAEAIKRRKEHRLWTNRLRSFTRYLLAAQAKPITTRNLKKWPLPPFDPDQAPIPVRFPYKWKAIFEELERKELAEYLSPMMLDPLEPLL
jgi:DNA-directed RNA polymerase subunit RPC12/RpoP